MGEESVEMLAWVSENHTSPETRDHAMCHLAKYAPGSEVALEVARNRRSDPDPLVRWHALGYQVEMMGTKFLP